MSILVKIVIVVVVLALVWTFWMKDTNVGRQITRFFSGATELNPKVQEADAQMRQIAGGVRDYFAKHNKLPPSLAYLFQTNMIRYLEDPWGTRYDYAISREGVFTIRCAGPDKELGTSDDRTKDWTIDSHAEFIGR